MAGILTGTKVVDLTTGMVGAAVGMIFADHGADFIKVEPVGGDPVREWDASLVWHRGKQSIVADLAKPQGRDLLFKLLEGADILIENFRPGEAKKLGIDYDSLKDKFPKLVYTSIEGYARAWENEARGHAHYGELIEARFGMNDEMRGYRPGPCFLGWPHSNWGTVFTTLYGATAALYHQRKTGHGQHVQTSLEDGAAVFSASRWLIGDNLPKPPYGTSMMTYRTVRAVVSEFECMDGEWMYIHTMARGAFTRLMKVLEFDYMIDPSVDPAREQAVVLEPELAQRFWVDLTAIFYSRDRDEWVDMIRAADIPCMPIYRRGQALEIEQARANNFVAEIDDPKYGKVKEVGLSYKFARTPGAVPPTLAAPAGANTNDILARHGYGKDEIAKLRSAGVVA